MLVSAAAVALVSLLPQGTLPQQQLLGGLGGGTSTPQAPPLGFPQDPAFDKQAPFVDAAGMPLAVDAAACGTADLDGDGNADAWIVGGPGTQAGVVSVQMARTSSLGRFRAWHTWAAGWPDATTYRSGAFNLGDWVLGIDPVLGQLVRLSFTHQGDLKKGAFGWSPLWRVDPGSYEIAARDDHADTHDDVVLLAAVTPGWTRIRKLRMGTSYGYLMPETEATCDLPLVLRDLRLLDVDGDGVHDILASVPGLGILVVRDDGKSLTPAWWVGLSSWLDIVTGDADRDGRDDFGAVGPNGVLLALAKPQGWLPVWLPAPAGASPLGAARVIGDRVGLLTSMVGFAADGQSIALWSFLGGASFGPPQIQRPATLTDYAGPGAIGERLVVLDADGDQDQDVLVQLPDRTHWLTLRNGENDLSPRVTITDLGSQGESSYRKYALDVQLPAAALASGRTWVELGVFLQDVRVLINTPYLYWGRLIQQADAAGRVTFYVWSLTDLTKLPALLNAGVPLKNDGISAGGDALVTIHWKQAPTGGTKRGQSSLVHHDGGGDGNKSAIGVKWRVNAAPPMASADAELMPWD